MSRGRKPRSPAERHTKEFRIALTPEDHEKLNDLANALGLTQSELIRRALKLLQASLDDGTLAPESRLSGDEVTVAAKKAAIEAYRTCANAALAADRAGVNVRTLQYWASSDVVFRELAQEAQSLSVGRIRAKLYEQAAEGNTVAMFGVLNALDPQFGAIRTAMISKVVEPLLDLVIESARRYLSVDELQRFAVEVGRAGEQVSLQAARRSRG